MLEQVRRTLGFRVSLDALAKATLRESKSADGLQSVRWWNASKVDLVAKYCRTDVELTKRLHEYACRNGYLLFTDCSDRSRHVNITDWRTILKFRLVHHFPPFFPFTSQNTLSK